MEIKWFEPLQRGQKTAVEKPLMLSFTMKPRGIRLNASLTHALQEKHMEYVKLGLLDGQVFVISPSAKEEGGLRVSKGSKSSSAVISSGAVGVWAEQQGLVPSRVAGEWDQQLGLFKFMLDSLLNGPK